MATTNHKRPDHTNYPGMPPPLPGYEGTQLDQPMAGPEIAITSSEFEAWYGVDFLNHVRGYQQARDSGDDATARYYLKQMVADKEERIRDEHARAVTAERRWIHASIAYPFACLVVFMALWTATSFHFQRPVAPWEMFTLTAPPPPPPPGGLPHGYPPRP